MVASRTVNVAPLSRPALEATIVPPCASTIALEMARPSPNPPNLRVIELCPCSKALKILPTLSGSIPIPLSLMRISICPGCGFPVATEIWPFAGVNFTPFLIRFQKICCKRAESPCAKSSCAAKFRSTRSDFCEIPSRQISSARCNTS